MPLGLFQTKKDRMLKEKSKSTFDLLNNGSSKFDLPNGKALKKKSGSTLNLFATKSSNAPGQFPTRSPPDILINGLTKEHKVKSKSLFHLNEGLKIKSKSAINLTDSNNNSLGPPKEKTRFVTPRGPFRKISSGSSSSEDGSGNKNKNQVSSGKRSPTGLRSCKKFTLGGSTESMEGTREQRISDIAQLDNYIEYLKKSDDCSIVNFSNRLCCAQVLRLVLLRQERLYSKDASHGRVHDKNFNLNKINNVNSNNVSGYCDTKRDTEPKSQGSALDNGHLSGMSHPINRNLLPANHSTPSSSPETQRGERTFVRKGSNRRFKRSPMGQLCAEVSRSDSGRYNNSDTSFREDDESGGSSEDNFCKNWTSNSSTSLTNSISSLDSPETEDAPSSPRQKHHLTVAVFSEDVEIY